MGGTATGSRSRDNSYFASSCESCVRDRRLVVGERNRRQHSRRSKLVSPSVASGIPESTIERLTHEYATRPPAFIRVNYGLQRHAGGGMAVRNIFCLPALIGSWRYAGGGAVLSTSGFFKY